MKIKTKTIIMLTFCVVTSLLLKTPVNATEGQIVDHIFLFEPPQTVHSYNISLLKNQEYELTCTLYSPGVSVKLILELIGPDGDGDGTADQFLLGMENLDDTMSSARFMFGCAIAGDYVLNIKGFVTEYTNIHLAIYDRRISHEKSSSVLYDIAGYYNTKIRQYWFELEEDIKYTMSISSTNTFPDNESTNEEIKKTFVTVNIYDEQNREFKIIRNTKLENADSINSTSVTFGVSHTGIYCALIEITTNIDTVNILATIIKGDPIGVNPIDDPMDPGTNSTSGTQLYISVPKWTFGIVFAGGMVFVLIAVTIVRERKMKQYR